VKIDLNRRTGFGCFSLLDGLDLSVTVCDSGVAVLVTPRFSDVVTLRCCM
jgi:hypothetical protein